MSCAGVTRPWTSCAGATHPAGQLQDPPDLGPLLPQRSLSGFQGAPCGFCKSPHSSKGQGQLQEVVGGPRPGGAGCKANSRHRMWDPEARRAEPRDRPWATHLPLWASVSICKIGMLPVRSSPGCHEGSMTKRGLLGARTGLSHLCPLPPPARGPGLYVAHIRQSAHIRCSFAFVRQVTVNASVLRI